MKTQPQRSKNHDERRHILGANSVLILPGNGLRSDTVSRQGFVLQWARSKICSGFKPKNNKIYFKENPS